MMKFKVNTDEQPVYQVHLKECPNGDVDLCVNGKIVAWLDASEDRLVTHKFNLESLGMTVVEKNA
jgi:hypothetical protein